MARRPRIEIRGRLYHLISLSQIIQRIPAGYSRYDNREHKKIGQVFQDPEKSILCKSDPHLRELVRYIHLNPVRARVVKDPGDYEYRVHRHTSGWTEAAWSR